MTYAHRHSVYIWIYCYICWKGVYMLYYVIYWIYPYICSIYTHRHVLTFGLQSITGTSGAPNCGTRVILTAAPGELHLSHSKNQRFFGRWSGLESETINKWWFYVIFRYFDKLWPIENRELEWTNRDLTMNGTMNGTMNQRDSTTKSWHVRHHRKVDTYHMHR